MVILHPLDLYPPPVGEDFLQEEKDNGKKVFGLGAGKPKPPLIIPFGHDQAQFRELEAFSKFGSDLDAATKAVLDKGSRNVEILKQPQYSPMKVEEQIAILYCGTKGLLQKIPVNKVKDFELEYLHHMQLDHKIVLESLKGGNLTENDIKIMEQTARELAKKYEI